LTSLLNNGEKPTQAKSDEPKITMKYYNKFTALCLSSCITLCASSVQEEILMIVNNHIVTRKVFQKEVDIYCREKQNDNISTDLSLAKKATLQNLIDSYVLIDKANDIGVTISDEDMRTYVDDIKNRHGFSSDVELELAIKKDFGVDLKFFLNNLRRNIIKREIIRHEVPLQTFVTNKELQDYYLEHKNEYQKVSRFRISELVLPRGSTPKERENSEKKIHYIQENFKHTGDFESLVRANSTAPSSSFGGDIGWITINVLHPELEKAVLTISRKGQISNPIEIGNDIYLIQLSDIEHGSTQPFEAVQELIKTKLIEIKTRHRESMYVNSLITRADIRYIIPKEIILKE